MDWKLAEAKNKLSEVVRRAIDEGPQRVLRRDGNVVIVAEHDYELLAGERRGLKRLLLDGPGLDGVDLTRDRTPIRDSYL